MSDGITEVTARAEAAEIIKLALSVGSEIVHIEEYEGDGDEFIEANTLDSEDSSGYAINIPADIGSENAGDDRHQPGLNEIIAIVIEICYNPQKKTISEISTISKNIKAAFVEANNKDMSEPWVWPTGAVTTMNFDGGYSVRQIFLGARVFTI